MNIKLRTIFLLVKVEVLYSYKMSNTSHKLLLDIGKAQA